MSTHKIKADLDVDGGIKGDSLDIDGNADILGNLTLSGTYPRIKLTDSNNNDDFDIINNNGTFIIFNDIFTYFSSQSLNHILHLQHT